MSFLQRNINDRIEYISGDDNIKSEIMAISNLKGVSMGDLPDDLRNDPEVVRKFLKKSHFEFQHASSELKSNKEFVLSVIEFDENCLFPSIISAQLKNDRDVARKAISHCGYQLRAFPSYCRNDPELVMIAVKNTKDMLKHASLNMKNNKEIV
jgi:hypothetical protein